MDRIAHLAENNEQFLILYKELYYKHLQSINSAELSVRCESWENYCALFDMVLRGSAASDLELPHEWSVVGSGRPQPLRVRTARSAHPLFPALCISAAAR